MINKERFEKFLTFLVSGRNLLAIRPGAKKINATPRLVKTASLDVKFPLANIKFKYKNAPKNPASASKIPIHIKTASGINSNGSA